MQALKLKGKIDESGHLIITEPIDLTPGEVEVILLKPIAIQESTTAKVSETTEGLSDRLFKTTIEEFQDLFTDTTPVPTDFDYDRAKWEYLKEKHDL
ncbi:MAG: hypothetical protein J7647_14405 [Cyanobacteria bacterium SBLK]|nr:hypothetical protein [Cyanobacteria bacterium SBLK]